MNRNPWNLELLHSYIGQEESYELEFKSSTALTGDDGKARKFLADLTCHVSAFLNSEGGRLLIGIEEAESRDKKQAEKAVGLSLGVPRSRYTAARISSAICDQIHPSVASYVSVFPVIVGQVDGEDLQAFVVDVKPGVTAYQAADKHYYARRSYSSEPMEDKDIRLRMLADEKPRGELRYRVTWGLVGTQVDDFLAAKSRSKAEHDRRVQERGSFEALSSDEMVYLQGTLPPKPALAINVTLALFNAGMITIKRGAISRGELEIEGWNDVAIIDKPKPTAALHLDLSDEAGGGLYPEMECEIAGWRFQVDPACLSKEGRLVLKSIVLYLDNGTPIRAELDLTNEIRHNLALACTTLGIDKA
jgi:hypothetical protein